MKSCLLALSLYLISLTAQAHLIWFNTGPEYPQGVRKAYVDLPNGRKLVFSEVCILETESGFELVTPSRFYKNLEDGSIKVAVELVDLYEGGMREVIRVSNSEKAVDYENLIALKNHPAQVQKNWLPTLDRYYLTHISRKERLKLGNMGGVSPVQKINYLGQDERGEYTFFLKARSERKLDSPLFEVERLKTTDFEKYHVEIKGTLFNQFIGPSPSLYTELQEPNQKAYALAGKIAETKFSMALSMKTSLPQRKKVRSSVSNLLSEFKNVETLLQSLSLTLIRPQGVYRKISSSKTDESVKLKEIQNPVYVSNGDLIEFDGDKKIIRTLSADQVVLRIGSLDEFRKDRIFIDTVEGGIGSLFLKAGHLASVSALNKFRKELREGLLDFLKIFKQGVERDKYPLSKQEIFLERLKNIFQFAQGLPAFLINLSSEREKATAKQSFSTLGEFVAFYGESGSLKEREKKFNSSLRLRPTGLEIENAPTSEPDLLKKVGELRRIETIIIEPGSDVPPQRVLLKLNDGIIYYLDERGEVPEVKKIHAGNAYTACTIPFTGEFKFKLPGGDAELL